MIRNKKQEPAEPARLSDAALVLLSEAANQEDNGMVLPVPASLRARGGALDKILTKLLRQRLVEEVAVASPEQAWRSDEDGRRIGLRITEAGLQAIGAPAPHQRLGTEEQFGEQLSASSPQARKAGGNGRKSKAEKRAAPRPRPTDAGTAGPGEAEPDPAPAPAAKPGSKQALLIEQLDRPAGARIADLVTALGWQAHTVRAALTRLRQQGHAIARSRDERGETVYHLGHPDPKPDGAAQRTA